jgi:TetR/AcrR family transcriptional regulator, mexJK operon transcriptional repressor
MGKATAFFDPDGPRVGVRSSVSKQQEVLDVATDYFLEHGYAGASVNAMARSSGISKESIYRYFAGKQALFDAVIERELAEYQERLRDLDRVLLDLDLREALLTVARTVLSLITSDRTLALRRLVFAEATRTPEMGQRYFGLGPGRAYARLAMLFEAKLDAASLSERGFDSAALSRHFVALVTHGVLLARECRLIGQLDESEVEARAEEIVNDFCTAFLPGGTPPDRVRVAASDASP